MPNLKDIVRYQAGQIQVLDATFTPKQREVIERIVSIADKNPSLDWKIDKQNHNRDFMLMESRDGVLSIEIVKEFMQKVTFTCGISTHAGDPMVVDLPPGKYKRYTKEKWPNGNYKYDWEKCEDKGVTVAVTCWFDDNPEHKITRNGSATLVECGYPTDSRAFHNAVARAQTRAMKIGVEELSGAPFLNYLLLMLFGNFEVTGAQQRGEPQDRTPPKADDEEQPGDEEPPKEKSKELWEQKWATLPKANQELILRMRKQLDASVKGGYHTSEERATWGERWRAVAENYGRLQELMKQITAEIGVRMTKPGGSGEGNPQ